MNRVLDGRAKTILNGLNDVPPADRPAAAVTACGADTELLDRVRSLLAAAPDAGPRPSDATVDADTTGAESSGPDGSGVAAVGEKPGDRIGRFKLLAVLGEGGFGVVFRAEQEHPVRREVALKVIKLGMDTREVVARFEAERQALALMDHPNIARVFDGGATAAGRPYFVMELVRGSPVTEYSDARRLSTRDRVALAAQICRAVQHAHTKGVIHRDLKPSNVLVATADDGRPVPKVIDFGIAKATGPRLTERTLFTAHRQLIGTPQYMSPEQAENDGADVDTRTDVFSLGVLLYELLVGTTPMDAAQLRSVAFDAVRRLIRDGEPPKPSVRLSTLGDTLASVAAVRGTDPRRLNQTVRGELDWIVMRAMEKDRARRYETAAAMAEDLDRHLAGDAVAAGPPSRAYRLAKFARRHRPLLWTSAVVVAGVGVGVGGLGVGLVRATRAASEADRQRVEADRQRVEADRQRAAAQVERDGARAAVTYLTGDVLDAGVRDQPHDSAARRALAAMLTRPAVLDVAARFPNHPSEAASVREALAWALEAVGESRQAAAQADLALAARRTALGEDDPATIRAEVLTARFRLHAPSAKVRDVAHDAYDRARRVCGDRDPTTLFALFTYAMTVSGSDSPVKALPLIRAAYQGQLAVLGPDHPDTLQSLEIYGVITEQAGFPEQAVGLTREAFDRGQKVEGPDAARTIWSLAALANALHAAGREAEAVDRYADASARMTRWLGATHPTTQMYTGRWAHALVTLGRQTEAEPILTRLLAGVAPAATTNRSTVLGQARADLDACRRSATTAPATRP